MSASPVQGFGWRNAAVAGSLVLYFTACLLMLPGSMLVPAMMLPGLPFLLFAVPDPRRWLLLLPPGIALGYSEVMFGQFPLFMGTVVLFSGYIIYLVAKTASSSPSPVFGRFALLVLLSYLAQAASILVSVHVHGQHVLNAVREAHKFFIPALLPFIIMDWYGKGEWFNRLLKSVAVTLLVLSVYGIIQFLSGAAWSVGEVASGYQIAGRAFSTIRGGANSYSGFLELTVPTTLAAAFHFREKRWKALCFTAVGLGILNGLYTYSRGGFLTISLASLAYLVYRFRRRVWVPILSALVFAGAIAGNADKFSRQLVMLTNPSGMVVEATLLHRYVSYNRFILDIRASPVTGVGWGAREYFSSGSSLYSFWEVRHERSTDHIREFGGLNSLVFDMLLKGGAASGLSLLLLAAAAVYVASRALRFRREDDLPVGIVCGLTAFGVHQAVDNLLQWPQTGSFFWIVLGLLAVLGREHIACSYNTVADHVTKSGAESTPSFARE